MWNVILDFLKKYWMWILIVIFGILLILLGKPLISALLILPGLAQGVLNYEIKDVEKKENKIRELEEKLKSLKIQEDAMTEKIKEDKKNYEIQEQTVKKDLGKVDIDEVKKEMEAIRQAIFKD